MEVNPPQTPRSLVADQSLSGPVKSSNAASSAADHGPALKVETSSATNVTSIKLDGDSNAEAPQTEELEKAETLRNLISDRNMQLTTYHDEASGHSVLRVTDQATGKVVNQYPSDELLRLYAALREPLVDQSA